MVAGRRVSQEQAFASALKSARRSTGTSAAEQALHKLKSGGAPAPEQAQIVQRFLDSHDASALSAKARELLRDFIAEQGAPASGESLTEARRAQQAGPAAQEKAQLRLVKLLEPQGTPSEKEARAKKVGAWLDDADAELAQAGARLAALALGTKGGASELRPTRVEAMRRAFARLDRAGTLSWTPGGVAEQHLGVRFVRVELMKERRPDGFTFAAFVPVGALSPGAAARDPNRVREFYVERSGGLAGLTLSVGPLTL